MLESVKAITFDVFGTVLDLQGSLEPFIARFLERKKPELPAADFYRDWRARQRHEQFKDSLMMVGHAGYLETVRRALHFTLRVHGLDPSQENQDELMSAWQELRTFPEVRAGLEKLKPRLRLVVLSNGDPEFLDHLVKNRIEWEFDEVVSVSRFGCFKPHPAVYRGTARLLGLEVNECLMVSANPFDVVGARACGFRAAYIRRTDVPYDDAPYLPDIEVPDFTALAEALC